MASSDLWCAGCYTGMNFYCHCELDINIFLCLLQVLTAGEMRVGWARPGCLPDQELGSDDQAFVFDGFKVAGFFFPLPIC